MNPTFGAEFLSTSATPMFASKTVAEELYIPPKPLYQVYDLNGDGIPDAMRYI